MARIVAMIVLHADDGLVVVCKTVFLSITGQIAETGLQAVFDAVEESKPAPAPKQARAPRPKAAAPPRKRRKRYGLASSEVGSSSEEEVIKASVGTRRSARAVQNTRTQAEIEIALAVRSFDHLNLIRNPNEVSYFDHSCRLTPDFWSAG